MSGDSPVGAGVHKLLTYSFMLLAAALMLSWAWDLLQPLVPVIVAAVALVALVAGVIRFLVGREGHW